MEKTSEKVNKAEKQAKPFVKFIWLGIAVILATVGFFLRKNNPELPFAEGAVISALTLICAVIAAQGQNAVRNKYSETDEDGKRLQKGKYFGASVVYYLFILAAVVMLFLSFWVVGLVSI